MAACVQASLLFRVAADTSIPGKETTGEKRHGKNYQGYTTLIDCSSPSTSFWDVARFRYTGNYSQKRRNAMFFGEGGHSARFPDCHEPIFLLLFHSSLDRYRFVVPSPAI